MELILNSIIGHMETNLKLVYTELGDLALNLIMGSSAPKKTRSGRVELASQAGLGLHFAPRNRIWAGLGLHFALRNSLEKRKLQHSSVYLVCGLVQV